MAAADERPPLETLTTAHAASNEVSERGGRECSRAHDQSDLVERATAARSTIILRVSEQRTTFTRAASELVARVNTEITSKYRVSCALAPQKPAFQDGGITLLSTCCPSGTPAEVLVITLALIQLDLRSGGVDNPVEPWIARVLADSADYKAYAAWASPESWRTDARWVNAQLNTALSLTKAEDVNAIAAAFHDAAIDHGGSVAFVPTRSMLTRYFAALRNGTLKGVGDSYASRAPKRSVYLAPRVARLAHVHGAALRAALQRCVDEVLELGDGKAVRSASKGVLKGQLAQLQLEQRELIEELETNDAEVAKLKRHAEHDAKQRDDLVPARVAGRAATITRRADVRVERESERARADVCDEMAALREELERTQRELRTATATAEALRVSNDEKSFTIERLEGRLKRCNGTRVYDLEATVARLKHEVKSVTKQLDDADAENASLKKRIADADAEHASTKKRLLDISIPRRNG